MTIIVKIGGSLTRSAPPHALLADLSARRGVVLVPGGGALADQIRALQPQMGLSDAAAHRMAILAMEQMAHAFLDMAPKLVPAHTLADLTDATAAGARLWFPASLSVSAPDIRESWDVTSDSLALWLAATLKAERLVLVKAPGVRAAASGDRAADLDAWSRAGLVDAAFATMAQRYSGDILAVPADDGALMEQALAPTASNACEHTREGPERR